MTATAATLAKRALIIQAIRAFFIENGFLEVETPLLVDSPGMEPHLEAFVTTFVPEFSCRKPSKVLYLPTSPEFHMKRLLCRGFNKIFQITRAFRNGETGQLHQPEFSMLEWYRADDSYESIMTDVENLFIAVSRRLGTGSTITFGSTRIDLRPPWTRMTVKDAWKNFCGIDLDQNPSAADLRTQGRLIGVHNLLDEDSWDILYFKIFLDRIEPRLGIDKPLILYEYPAGMSALARIKPDDPSVALRFEIYAAGMELGNAFDELTDARLQRTRCEEARNIQIKNGKIPFPIDESFLDALESGMPPSAGIAVGIDRIVMLFLNIPDMSNVLAFPFGCSGAND